MRRITDLWRNLLRRAHVERELDDELRATVELLVDEKVHAGMAPDEARRAARVEVGALEAIKDNVRDAHAGALVDRLVRDLRHASRGLRHCPGVSLTIVLTFALGASGAIALFALVNAIVIQPLPYPQADRLVAIRHAAPGMGLTDTGLSGGTYFHYRRHARSFESIAVYYQAVRNLAPPDTVTERVSVTFAGPEFFELLGVTPVAGRLFTIEDGRPGFRDTTWPVPVLLSHDLWQGRYGGDPGIVGRTITVSERPRAVVGVLPADFAFPDSATQIWMLNMPVEQTASFASSFDYEAIARLRPGVGAAAAEQELARLVPAMVGVFGDATAARLAEVALKPMVMPLKDRLIGGVRTLLLVVFGGMVLLLAVAGANITNLFLLRAEERDRETAVRGALGARRVDLLRLFLGEAALLATAGAAAGLLLAQLELRALAILAPVRLPRAAEVGQDGWVFGFTCALAILVTLLLGGLAFLRQSVTVSAAAALKASAAMTGPRGSMRGRDFLVTLQVATALMLLVGSALMAQTFWRLMRIDPGFDPADVLTIEVGLPGSKAAEHQRIYEDVLQRVRALPGVTSAGAVSALPLDARRVDAFPLATTVAPVRAVPPATMKFVTRGYLETMRIPVRLGAGLAVSERIDRPDPVVVNEVLARRLFPGEDPIGRTIVRRGFDGEEVLMWDRATKSDRPIPPWTIVGVMGDTREESLRASPAELVYVPIQSPPVERMFVPTNVSLVIRTGAFAPSLAGAVRDIIRDVEPSLSVARVRSMQAVAGESVASERFLAILLIVAAASALFLALVGVFSVAAHAVRRRQQEIGIRASLGARPGQLVAMVARHALLLVAAGTVVGVTIALATARTLRSFLFEVTATDPLTLAVVTAMLTIVAGIATVVPARRAATLDPVTALRSE
jgi:predicted permease